MSSSTNAIIAAKVGAKKGAGQRKKKDAAQTVSEAPLSKEEGSIEKEPVDASVEKGPVDLTNGVVVQEEVVQAEANGSAKKRKSGSKSEAGVEPTEKKVRRKKEPKVAEIAEQSVVIESVALVSEAATSVELPEEKKKRRKNAKAEKGTVVAVEGNKKKSNVKKAPSGYQLFLTEETKKLKEQKAVDDKNKWLQLTSEVRDGFDSRAAEEKAPSGYELYLAEETKKALEQKTVNGEPTLAKHRWQFLTPEQKETWCSRALEEKNHRAALAQENGSEETAPKKCKMKKAPSPYILFTKKMRPNLDVSLSFAEKGATLGSMWRELSAEEKSIYTQLCVTMREELLANPIMLQAK